jgi:glycosyltransferase involved in cell wall biosynthesis
MDNKLISVVIPVYNRKDELLRAVKSVLMQTKQPLEILVIDDFSNFNVSNFLHSELESSIVKVISNEFNMGAAKSRNIGVNVAIGDYIAFLDSDDYWYNTKLASQIDMFIKKPVLDLVYTDQLLDRAGVLLPSGKKLINEQLTAKLINGWTAPNTSTLMFKKKSLLAIEGFNENLKSCQDHDLWFKVAKAGMKVDYVSDALSVFVLESSNRISYNLEKRMDGVTGFLAIWKTYIIEKSSDKYFVDFSNEYFYKTSFPIFVLAVKNKVFSNAFLIFFKYLLVNRHFYRRVFITFMKKLERT